jgi:hypothetical protein
MKYKAPSSRRAIAMLAATCGLLGAAIAGLAMLIAWDHNPQGAFHELDPEGTHVIHFGSWCLVGVSWFVVTFVPPFLVGSGLIALWLRLSRKPVAHAASRLRDPAP